MKKEVVHYFCIVWLRLQGKLSSLENYYCRETWKDVVNAWALKFRLTFSSITRMLQDIQVRSYHRAVDLIFFAVYYYFLYLALEVMWWADYFLVFNHKNNYYLAVDNGVSIRESSHSSSSWSSQFESISSSSSWKKITSDVEGKLSGKNKPLHSLNINVAWVSYLMTCFRGVRLSCLPL